MAEDARHQRGINAMAATMEGEDKDQEMVETTVNVSTFTSEEMNDVTGHPGSVRSTLGSVRGDDEIASLDVHTTIHVEPRPLPYDRLRYIYAKRVFITPPEVLNMAVESGQKVLNRMLGNPLKTFVLAVEAGFLLSFGVLLSVQVGGRFGSTTGANNLMFAGFGIPFGLTFLVIVQGSELMTANYLYVSFVVLLFYFIFLGIQASQFWRHPHMNAVGRSKRRC